MRQVRLIGLVLLCHWLTGGVETAFAQGLIWSLPKEDFTEVRYEGEYKQVQMRPDSPEGDMVIKPWTRKLWLRSVGREQRKYDKEKKSWGRLVDGEKRENNEGIQWCRWIEIELVTGRIEEGTVDPGPAGVRICKVLVLEARITGKRVDDQQIHISYLPIVEGYRQVGDEEPKRIEDGMLQVHPLLSMLMHYKDLKPEGDDAVDPDIPLDQPVTARILKGHYEMESPTSRSVNDATLWVSDDVPFGLAKWKVKADRYAKDARESRSDFQHATSVEVEMSAHGIKHGAESKLALPAGDR